MQKMSASQATTPFRIEVALSPSGSTVSLAGRMDAPSIGSSWAKALAAASSPPPLTVNLAKVEYMDGAGVALLLALKKQNPSLSLTGLREEHAQLLAPFEKIALPENFKAPAKKDHPIAGAGKLTHHLLLDLREQIAFVGKLSTLLCQMLFNPKIVRWHEVFLTFQKVGTDAIGIVALIGFLMGMILAFQSAIPLKQFGVDIFVVNLVALAMFRELGVIMTAIVLAGRSGSAFAAEIGTMKVNEEINALNTMGLDPDRFLVLPRVIAGILAMPFLTIYANVIGIFGGMLVATTFGHNWQVLWAQLLTAVAVSDVLTGLIKSFFFGFLISSTGCLRGLQTKLGALAVGESTTRSVVSSIVLIILTDGIFAVVFYAVGF